MARALSSTPKRPRISIDVDLDLRRRIRLAAARRDLSVRDYLLETIQERLRQDAEERSVAGGPLTSATDPVLAELWDNPRDAVYDRL